MVMKIHRRICLIQPEAEGVQFSTEPRNFLLKIDGKLNFYRLIIKLMLKAYSKIFKLFTQESK